MKIILIFKEFYDKLNTFVILVKFKFNLKS